MRRLLACAWGVALSVLCCGGHPLLAQFNGVQVNVDQFGNDILFDAANEPSIAVDPLNPNRIAIGWRQFDTINSDFRQAGVGYSTDGGQTWTASVLDPGQFRSDPVLDFDADGNFYYSSLSSLSSIEMFKSTDGGASWSNPVPAFGGDKQWIAVDRTSGIGRGNIYQHWNVQFTGIPDTNFTRSINGGASFQTSISGPTPYMKWGTMDVGPDGTLYLAGSDLNTDDGHLFSKSITAQDSTQTPTFSMSEPVFLGGTTSSFGDLNPSGLLGQVSIATDHSQSSSHGNVYILGSVDPPGPDPLDVMLIRSIDGGDTWSSPIRVNNDPGNGAYQWFGTMSVAPNGRIDVIWNDTRNDASDQTSELFYAYSMDAGETWSGNTALSMPFDPSLGYPVQQKMGDYYDMVSDNHGASLAYTATFNGGQDVYYLRIEEILSCDFNGDNLCNITDLNAMLAGGPIAGGVSVTPGIDDAFDLTGDGVIDLDDQFAWLSQAGAENGLASSYKLGDANLDGVVDGSDFILWNGQKFTDSLRWDRGDFNGDGFVDGADFIAWNANKFTASDQFAAVPEPAVGLGTMLLVLLSCSRSRRV